MRPDLLELTQNYFIGSTVRQVSAAFNESESSISTALRQAAPVALDALLTRTQQPGGATDVFARVYRVHRRHLLAHLDGLLEELTASEGPTPALDGGLPGPGSGLLRAALGQRYAPTVAGISQHASLPPDTVGKLLSLALAVELSLLGRYAAEHTLDARGLASYLATQHAPTEEELVTTPTAGIAWSDSLATGAAAAPGSQAPPASPPLPPAPVAPPAPVVAAPTTAPPQPAPVPPPEPTAPTAATHRRWPWLVPLLLVIALAIAAAQLYFLFWREAAPPALPSATPAAERVSTGTAPQPTDRPEVAGSTPLAYIAGRTTLLMPGRPPMRVSNNSTEARLYKFLHDPAQTVSLDKTQGWILLDQVYFKPGTTALTPEALVQLRKVAIILKAFPRAVIKLGGYTDDRSSANQNLVTSADCANATRRLLLAHRIAPNRVSAEGYGQAPTRTALPAGHSQSRRVYVRVVKKY